jgi:putative transposase
MELGIRMDALRFLVRDRDTKFIAAFDEVFRADGVRIIKIPPQAPRANATCERVIGTLRREVLDRMLIFNERHLSRILTEYAEHLTITVRTRPAASDRQLSKPRSRDRLPSWPTFAPSSGNRSSAA